ncbi:FG-GAP repeat domain-containing protein [Streptomyces sp. MAR4 CNY-716]
MIRRTALPALALCPLLVLTACGDDDGGGGPSPSADGAPESGVPAPPTASRAPAPGEGSQDPDDINGDGHRDLLVPVFLGGGEAAEQRVAVVYGTADGLDPATRTVYGRGDLGLPALPADSPAPDQLNATGLTTADLDDDGFPDFVTTAAGAAERQQDLLEQPELPYVTFGGPEQPVARPEAVALRLPPEVTGADSASLVRGDFDADGHHDLAMQQRVGTGAQLVVLYGPFSRAGEPARTDTGLPAEEGTLRADDIDPSGEPRATALLRRGVSDGEQGANTLYPASPGTGLSGEVRELTAGSAYAFGDFDGDGRRDVAVGDDGGRNNEPGYETEAPEVDGKATLYPGDGGEPVVLDLPEPPAGEEGSYYGPGGFAAADPDGDGRDGLLVSTYDGATLIDGDERTAVLREGPARTPDGERTPAEDRNARPAGAADFDGDGRDELVLNWAPDPLFALYGKKPVYWWITDGASARDAVTFTTTGFAPRRS